MFDQDWEDDFKRIERFAKIQFALVAILAVATLSGMAFVVYKVLLHFGIL